MRITTLDLPDLKVIVPGRFEDSRGFFSELYNAETLKQAGISEAFVQDNFSFSAKAGTVRGLHFQIPPASQAKLVRVAAGSIFDVAVDIRAGSPTYGRHVAIILSAEQGNQLFVPEGFAHGFCTLEPDTEVFYKVSSYYSREHDSGLAWDDPQLGIDWPVAAEQALLSDKDRRQPLLANLPVYFRYR
jgi:dTDP-4-dehydrorhamnose 3,5-epimerase